MLRRYFCRDVLNNIHELSVNLLLKCLNESLNFSLYPSPLSQNWFIVWVCGWKWDLNVLLCLIWAWIHHSSEESDMSRVGQAQKEDHGCMWASPIFKYSLRSVCCQKTTEPTWKGHEVRPAPKHHHSGFLFLLYFQVTYVEKGPTDKGEHARHASFEQMNLTAGLWQLQTFIFQGHSAFKHLLLWVDQPLLRVSTFVSRYHGFQLCSCDASMDTSANKSSSRLDTSTCCVCLSMAVQFNSGKGQEAIVSSAFSHLMSVNRKL